MPYVLARARRSYHAHEDLGGKRKTSSNLYDCLFISPNEVAENNVVNDDGLPLHVDEVGVFDLF